MSLSHLSLSFLFTYSFEAFLQKCLSTSNPRSSTEFWTACYW